MRRKEQKNSHKLSTYTFLNYQDTKLYKNLVKKSHSHINKYKHTFSFSNTKEAIQFVNVKISKD